MLDCTFSICKGSVHKGSVILPLAVAACMAGLPAQAATLAESTGSFSFENFSTVPLGANATVDESFFNDGIGAIALSSASATFDQSDFDQSDFDQSDFAQSNFGQSDKAVASGAITSSAATASSPGIAFAKSDAALFGDFAVKAGEAFSFDFSGFADLLTSTDRSGESASAFFETQYSIFRSDIGVENGTVVDSFRFVGSIDTPAGDDMLDVTYSDAITFDALDVNETTGDNLLSEMISFDATGRYERTFEQDSIVTLVAFKVGVAQSAQTQQVPDSSSSLLGLLGVGVAALLNKRL